jgi:hypothetical protein
VYRGTPKYGSLEFVFNTTLYGREIEMYNGSQDVKVVRRYFNSATTLRKGQIIHYVENASKTDADPKLRLGHQVEPVNSDNLKFMAGIVPEGEAGKVGPTMVELLVPQSFDVLDVEADGTTDIAVGDFLEPDATLGALIDGTEAAGDNLFIALEAYAVDATKLAIRVQKV